MLMLKWIRYGAWAGVVLVAFVGAAILLGWWQVDGPGRSTGDRTAVQGLPAIGGAFTLVDHTGKTVTDADYRGKPMAVFFGFTHCPEVCPTTLFEITTRLKKLGPDADKLQVLFITVDPERDTPQQLALYLQSFDPRIVGLSGTREQVDATVAAYKAYAKRIPTDGGYTMDHTASTYLMDAQGRFRTMVDYHEEEAPALAKMRLVLK
ncbi:SCO family protein [Bosea sp. RAC05]|uniref:SCO family protein n=1 Tax=Bosea sp. RAC05 TaxID=1842539 RepID=UPI00083E39F4|nr:SCO family protein [Bosea sp. RAC05]AOG06411.1 ahpC/TSA family protein [Bosea sp. RAC05]